MVLKGKWSQRFVNRNIKLDAVYKAILAVFDKGHFKIRENKIEQRWIWGEFQAAKNCSLGTMYITGDDADFSIYLEWETTTPFPFTNDQDKYFYLPDINSGKAWQRLTEIIPIIIEELESGVLNWFSSDNQVVKFLKYAHNKLKESNP